MRTSMRARGGGPLCETARVNTQAPRMAAVGHVEWVQFAHVEHVPGAGEVVHARDPFEEPAGGGAVAAVALARLAGSATLITALGSDEHGERSITRLRELGVEVRAQRRAEPTRRAVTLLDETGERTITTLGERLDPRGGAGELGLDADRGLDGAYLTAGDAAALAAVRANARVIVASPRAGDALQGIALDALVYSEDDEIEAGAVARLGLDARLVVVTAGEAGGRWQRDGERGSWRASAPPGRTVDSYGCGDSFAAGVTFALASGMAPAPAIELGARCGASCAAGRGPYGRQLQGCPP
jgi:ribokinase